MSYKTLGWLLLICATPLVLLLLARAGSWLENQWANTAVPSHAHLLYKTTPTGELNIELDLPPDWQPEDRRPVAVFLFGGGWVGGGPAHLRWQSQQLALRGLVGARIDYRTFNRHGTGPDAAAADAQDAIAWIRGNAAQLGADPERILAVGASAGAHLAANAAVHNQAKPQSAPNLLILLNPVLDLRHASAEMEFSTQELELIAGLGAELAGQLSPNAHIHTQMPPSLLFFGDKDPLLNQALDYIAAHRALALKSDLYVTPGQGHGFFNREPWRSASLQLMLDWLTEQGYLGNSGAPLSTQQQHIFRRYQP